jgi:hypothetical protein
MAQLPPDYQRLLNPNEPMPGDVQFFEEKATASWFDNRPWLWFAMSASMGVGMQLLLWGGIEIVTVLSNAAGATIGSWVGSKSHPRYRSLTVQAFGEQTRYGVFLTPWDIIVRRWQSWHVLDRDMVLGVENDVVFYPNAFGPHRPLNRLKLPKTLVDADREDLADAIRVWAGLTARLP